MRDLDAVPGRMMPALVGLVIWALLAAPGAEAAVRAQAGGHILVAAPQGEFADFVDDPGVGLGGVILARIPRSPLLVGAELGYLLYGSTERTEPFSETIPDVRVKVKTDNNLVQGGLVLRLQPPAGSFRPYLDGVLGFNYLYTSTSIRGRNNDEEVVNDTNQDDTALAYGGGGGLMVRVHSGRGEGGVRAVLLDGRVRYLAGGEAEYLKEGSIRRENGRVVYDKLRSKTDVLQIGIGVSVEF